jgi:hypothetical protein
MATHASISRGSRTPPTNRAVKRSTAACAKWGRLCAMVPVCKEGKLRFSATLGEEPEVEVALA